MESAINCRNLVPLLVVLSLAGCQSATLPDPNEPSPSQEINADVLLQNINSAIQTLDSRVATGEIDVAKRDEILKIEVAKMLQSVDVPAIPADQSWKYGDAFRLADDWATATRLYQTAVKTAKTDDRFVNDSLRLARALAHTGKVDDAIATCRSTFRVGPRDKAPILLAVLYEVVPEATGKGRDVELAKLLEEAIAQHEQTIVDEKSEAGKAFLLARASHVHNAWIRIARFYQDSGDQVRAREAIESDEAARTKRASI